MSGKKIYIVIEYIKDKLPGQSYPEVVGIKPHGTFMTKTAAEKELLKLNPFNAKIVTTTLQEV